MTVTHAQKAARYARIKRENRFRRLDLAVARKMTRTARIERLYRNDRYACYFAFAKVVASAVREHGASNAVILALSL